MVNKTSSCCILRVNIVAGRELKNRDPIGLSDPTVEIYLHLSNNRKRTKNIAESINPVWNEEFTFNLQSGDDIIHFDVYDEDGPLNEHDLIGSAQVELETIFDKKKFDEWIKIHETSNGTVTGEIHVIMHFF